MKVVLSLAFGQNVVNNVSITIRPRVLNKPSVDCK